MPYYIKQGVVGCAGWATIKDDGEIMGCHQSKADAIAQMVAISLEEGIEPGGERALPGEVAEGSFVSWFDEDAQYSGQIEYVMTEGTFGVAGGEYSLDASPDDPVALVRKWKPEPEEGYWEPEEELYGKRFSELITISPLPTEPKLPPLTGMAEESSERAETRAVDLSAPAYMREAAQRGLRLYAEGEAGDGLQPSTVREARLMARGEISEAKWRKIGPWIARHIDDLDAVQGDEITPGLVAHLLWGSGPSKSDAQRAQEYAQNIVERIEAEQDRSWRVRELEEIRKGGTDKVETRQHHQEFEVRQAANGMWQFRGYAAVFNSNSEPLPFTERILPGAFDRTLRSRNNIKMYLNHDSTLVLGSTRAKTVRLSTDSKGLLTDADLPDTSYARDLVVMMERGDVDSMSFGFSVPRNGDNWSEDGMTRELREVRLHEVSVVTGFPAYRATTATVRSLDALAEATGHDVDKLAEALTVLENGKPLSDDYAQMLADAVGKLRATQGDPVSLLALKAKHLDLLKQQF
jgi:HK97 family phage prohead protease